jgi:tetratricopeptide (TPR) repeat protein
MTGQDFGSERRSYERWRKWWYDDVAEKLPKRRKDTKGFLERARAERKNEEGEFQLAGGNGVVALNLFREAVALDGSKAVYHSNLGLALLRLDQHESAEARFEDAIAVDKNYIPAYLNKGTVYADLADKVRAAAVRMESAMAAHKAAGDEKAAARLKAELDRALARIRGLDNKAIDTFQHAIAVNQGRDLWAAHYLMGRVYKRRGDFEKAVGPLEKALELCSATSSLQRLSVLGHALTMIGIRSDLALTYYALDQYYSSWTQIQAVERLGGEMPKDFTQKVELKVKEMSEDLKK